MHVILVRHGRPHSVVDSITVADPSLDQIGCWQVERLTSWLACEEIDAVVTSPKERAIQTAAGVCAARGLAHQVIDGFNEIDRGAHTYLPTEILHTEGGTYWEMISQKRYEEIGWDNPDAFRSRVMASWNELCRNPPGERVLLSCHAGTIGAILADVVGNASANFRLDYTSISRVEVTPASGDTHSDESLNEPYCSVISTNETAHFDAERTTVVGAFRGAPRPGTTINQQSETASQS